jgi:hypothetical protein
MQPMKRRQRWWAVAALAGIVVALVAVAASGSFAGGTPRVIVAGRHDAAQSEPPATTVVDHYSIFQRTASTSDSLPAGVDEEATVTARRQQADATDIMQWATATGETICVVDRYTPASSPNGVRPDTNQSCNQVANLEAEHQLLVQSSLVGGTSSTPPKPGLANVISGLAPNGVTSVTITFSDGTSLQAPVVENGFSYQIVGEPKAVSDVSWTTATGQHYSQNG